MSVDHGTGGGTASWTVGSSVAMDDTTPDPTLRAAALEARSRAHSPYSKYAVGAALRTATGKVFSGCNVENASYPEGTCAETGAIAAMVLGGEASIVEVVVVTGGDVPGTPCGGCRQRLREFAGPDAVIHSSTVDGATVRSTMAELLPDSFGPERLSIPQD
jgi:cytidine deaminase